MPEPGTKAPDRRRILCVLIAAVLFLTLGSCAIQNRVERQRVRDLLQAHASAPCAETTARILRALRNNQFGTREGNRVLASVITPKVSTREAYAADRKIFVAIEHPHRSEQFSLTSVNLSLNGRKHAMTLGKTGGGNIHVGWRDRSVVIHGGWHGTLLGAAAHNVPPGQYQAELTLSYEMRRYRKGFHVDWGPVRRLWNTPMPDPAWAPVKMRTPYKCDVKVPFTLTIKPSAELQKVQQKTGAEVDKTMRQGFKHVPCAPGEEGPMLMERGGRRFLIRSGGIDIGPLPEHVAFRVLLRDEKEVLHRLVMRERSSCLVFAPVQTWPCDILLHAGEQARFSPRSWIGSNALKNCAALGSHHLALVFEPAPDIAYMDPRIDTVWGGAVEIPVTVEVKPSPSSAK